jgi:hypothetical protein
MADAFFQALCCQPVTVFGVKLKPFSLSHSYLLDGLDNPWPKHANGSRSALIHAVWVCSQDHDANVTQVLRPPLWRMFWTSVRSRRFDYATERQAFVQYMANYMEIPDHWYSGAGSSKGFRAPWQFHFAMGLTQHCGMTLREAWNTPVALARCWYDVWAEKQGDDSLVSVREQELAKAEGLAL